VTGAGAITFTVPQSTLKVTSGVPTTTFFGFADGDVIDLAGVAAILVFFRSGNNSYELTSGVPTSVCCISI